jgi:hypothetical protein
MIFLLGYFDSAFCKGTSRSARHDLAGKSKKQSAMAGRISFELPFIIVDLMFMASNIDY